MAIVGCPSVIRIKISGTFGRSPLFLNTFISATQRAPVIETLILVIVVTLSYLRLVPVIPGTCGRRATPYGNQFHKRRNDIDSNPQMGNLQHSTLVAELSEEPFEDPRANLYAFYLDIVTYL